MRQSFAAAYQDLENIMQHKQIFNVNPASVQESFLQTVGNIVLCIHKEAIGDMGTLLNSYKGSFSNLLLNLKYCTYCMEKDKAKNFQHFTILKLLAKWVETLQAAKKKKDVRLYDIVIGNLELGISIYEEFIVYLNYISFDITALIKSGSDEAKKSFNDLASHPHLDANDLTKFLSAILPKTLTNIIVPRNFFPPSLLKSNEQQVDLLYSNQNLQNIAQNKIHYNTLLRTLFKCILSMELQPSQIKQLILSSFKYYYLYHHDKSYCASQYVIESFKKMTSAVRYAIADEISTFILILKKLGKELFISYLSEKFNWLAEVTKNNNSLGISKSALKPYYNQLFGNSMKIRIDSSKKQNYFVQIYDRFTLMYFFINVLEYDVTIRLYYLGKFSQNQGFNEKKLLFFSDKRQGVFQGSIQVIQQGIYMFQFDNSYSWMKAKNITLDITLLVPIQIREQSKNRLKHLIYEKYDNMNEAPFENVAGWVDQNQIKVNSTTAKVNFLLESNVKVYNLKLIRNTGHIYEYETDSKSRFMKKLRSNNSQSNLFWFVDQFKVKGLEQVEKWLDGELEQEKLLAFKLDQKVIKNQPQLEEEEDHQQDKQQEKQQQKQQPKKQQIIKQQKKQQQKVVQKVVQEINQNKIIENEKEKEKEKIIEEEKVKEKEQQKPIQNEGKQLQAQNNVVEQEHKSVKVTQEQIKSDDDEDKNEQEKQQVKVSEKEQDIDESSTKLETQN